jgi:phosphoglycolate phosphatase
MRGFAAGADAAANARHTETMNRPRRFDLIVFDWDGTLYDSTAFIARCIQASCADLALPVPSVQDASYVIGMGLTEALQHAAPGLAPERYPELSARYKHHYVARQNDLSLFEGTLPMLHALRERQHSLAIATGKTRRGLDEVLHTVQLKGLFDATRTADETRSKPHPQMLQELMAEVGIAPERTLMIGDTTHDLQMARLAGVPSVGVSYGAHEPASFAAFEPLHIVHSVAELDHWLAQPA